MLNSY